MLTLKTLSPETGIVGIGRWVPSPSRQQSLTRLWRVLRDAPGSEVASSLTLRLRGNQGDPAVGVDGIAHSRTSLKSEEEGSDGRKSGVPI
jgi:hypothetical protein